MRPNEFDDQEGCCHRGGHARFTLVFQVVGTRPITPAHINLQTMKNALSNSPFVCGSINDVNITQSIAIEAPKDRMKKIVPSAIMSFEVVRMAPIVPTTINAPKKLCKQWSSMAYCPCWSPLTNIRNGTIDTPVAIMKVKVIDLSVPLDTPRRRRILCSMRSPPLFSCGLED